MTSPRTSIRTAARSWRLRALSLIVVATLACSSSVEPRTGVTLLVTNGSCRLGPCAPLEVFAFPSNQPNTPGGLWSLDLGVITTAQACLTLPSKAEFRVIGVRDGGGADTSTFTWTNAKALSLGGQPPSASRFSATPSTATFVPADAAGWEVTVPGSGSHPSQSSACTP